MSAKPLPAGYLYVSEAARVIDTTDRTVRGMFDRGELVGVRSPSGYRMIEAAALAGFRRHVSVKQAAKLMGVSADTVRLRFDAGLIDGFRTAAGARRIDPESLDLENNAGPEAGQGAPC